MNPGDEFRPHNLFYNVACIPFALLRYKGISPGGRLTYGVLAAHQGKNGECFVDRETLAEELCVSVPTIDRWLKELVDRGFIRRDQKGGGRPAICVFLWHPILAGSLKAPTAVIEQALSPAMEQGSALSPTIRQEPLSPIRNEVQPYQNRDSALSKPVRSKEEKAQEQVHEKVHTHSDRSSSVETPVSAFIEKLYARHPKKRNRISAQGEACRIYQSLNGNAATVLAEIDRVHALWCDTDEWKKQNGRFAPPLDQWLSDHGWTKEPDLW